MHNKMFCYNCHEYCHVAANCTNYFDSFGIICYYVDLYGKIKYLAIKRKYSIAYCEFIRGTYNILNFDYLKKLFGKMTLFEHHLLLTSEFKSLWDNLWICKNKKISNYFLKASIKFHILKKGYISIINNKICKMENIINDNKLLYKCSEWFFPKGKKELNEKSLESAIREFEEETNIKRGKINIFSDLVFKESHKSYNNKKYRTFFHIAKLNTQINNIDITKRNRFQKNEISNMEWLTFNECIKNFRRYETSKKKLLLDVHTHITKKELTCV